MENFKHFVFDLTCDVTGDLEVNFLNFIWKISSRPFHCRLNFFPTSVGPPPPPHQQRVGAGLGPAGRGLKEVLLLVVAQLWREVGDVEILRATSFVVQGPDQIVSCHGGRCLALPVSCRFRVVLLRQIICAVSSKNTASEVEKSACAVHKQPMTRHDSGLWLI